MQDNQLIAALIATIRGNLVYAGLPADLLVKQANQPTQQGAESKPTIYLSKVLRNRYGWPGHTDYFDAQDMKQRRRTVQVYQTTFQVNALAKQDPANINSLTAGDLLDRVATILNGPIGMAGLRTSGIGVLRVTEVRNPYFKDDMGRFEASPSFDIVLTHKTETVADIDAVAVTEINIGRV